MRLTGKRFQCSLLSQEAGMILLLRTHPGSQLFQRSTRIHGAHKSKDGWVAERHTIMA